VTVSAVGRKGVEHFRRRGVPMLAERTGMLGTPAPRLAADIMAELFARFTEARTDAVYLLYSRFRSAIAQVPTILPLLPVRPPENLSTAVDHLFEPARPALLAELLPRYVATLVAQALLEAAASEQGARMTAMDNATNNAADMIDRLTLSMNRARQAGITKELMEIVSGAEALRG
jgi:F-type H+-transporting ATPase subunit gamma